MSDPTLRSENLGSSDLLLGLECEGFLLNLYATALLGQEDSGFPAGIAYWVHAQSQPCDGNDLLVNEDEVSPYFSTPLGAVERSLDSHEWWYLRPRVVHPEWAPFIEARLAERMPGWRYSGDVCFSQNLKDWVEHLPRPKPPLQPRPEDLGKPQVVFEAGCEGGGLTLFTTWVKSPNPAIERLYPSGQAYWVGRNEVLLEDLEGRDGSGLHNFPCYPTLEGALQAGMDPYRWWNLYPARVEPHWRQTVADLLEQRRPGWRKATSEDEDRLWSHHSWELQLYGNVEASWHGDDKPKFS